MPSFFSNERTSAPYTLIVRSRSFLVWEHDHSDRLLVACGQVHAEKIGQVYLVREYTNV